MSYRTNQSKAAMKDLECLTFLLAVEAFLCRLVGAFRCPMAHLLTAPTGPGKLALGTGVSTVGFVVPSYQLARVVVGKKLKNGISHPSSPQLKHLLSLPEPSPAVGH